MRKTLIALYFCRLSVARCQQTLNNDAVIKLLKQACRKI